MSGLFLNLWLTETIDERQIKQIDSLVSQCGHHIGKSQSTWRERLKKPSSSGQMIDRIIDSLLLQIARYQVAPQHEPLKRLDKRPIDRILEQKISSQLKSVLIELDRIDNRHADDLASISWNFEFVDSSTLKGAPDVKNHKSGKYFPAFRIIFEQEPFRLLSGWGATQYLSPQSIKREKDELEAIVSQFGKLPVATATIFSPDSKDYLLAGYFAIALLDIVGGYFVVSARSSETQEELAHRQMQVKKWLHPGKMSRIITTGETEKFTRYVMDVDFLREWINHPSCELH